MFVVNFTYLDSNFGPFSMTFESESFKTTKVELDNVGLMKSCSKKCLKDVCLFILIRVCLIVEH